MRKFTRGEAPDFLVEKWEDWGRKYRENRERNSGFSFQWYTHQGQKINQLLEPVLKAQTQGHCSFCDFYPIRSREDSIDHFLPKSNPAFYDVVCQWENLYYSCQNCQGYKLEQYEESLLRPDDGRYSFDAYFLYNYRTHEIEPRPDLSDSDFERARVTIRIFGFKDIGHVAARRISYERYEGKLQLGEEIFVDDFPYRFAISG